MTLEELIDFAIAGVAVVVSLALILVAFAFLFFLTPPGWIVLAWLLFG